MTDDEKRARLTAVRVQLLRCQQSAEILAEHVIALELAGVRLPFAWRIATMLDDITTRWQAWEAGRG
jgi:hypothetical protein